MDFSARCTQIIKICFILLFALVPLLMTPWNYELFEYNKMMAVYALTVVIATVWGMQAIHEKKIVIPKTPLDIPIALFILSQTVSTLFSIDPHVSWLGYYSRFNGGLLSTLCYVALYYIFIHTYSVEISNHEYRMLNTKSSKKNQPSVCTLHDSAYLRRQVVNILSAALFSAFFVALYAVLERLGIDSHLWVQDVQSRVFSTLGQPNWLAAYLVALVPLAWAMGIESRITNIESRIKQIGYWSLSLVFFFVLLSTRSKSGLGAFVVADILFWGLLFFKAKLKKNLIKPLTIVHVAFAVIVFFNGIYIDAFDNHVTFSSLSRRFSRNEIKQSQSSNDSILPQSATSSAPLLQTEGTDSGIIRKYVWTGAITAWKSSIKTVLVGSGTETFAFSFFQFRPKGHNLTSEWDFLYNKAHNEYVNFLTTTGLFGLLSYVSLLGVFIVWFMRMLSSEYSRLKKTNSLFTIHNSVFTLKLALFSGWISILVTNFFGFSVVITQVFLFLLPAVILVLYKTDDQKNDATSKRTIIVSLQPPFDKISRWIVAASGVSLVLYLGILWDADRLFAIGHRYSRAGSEQEEQAIHYTEQAIARNPMEPLYHDELSTQLAALAAKTMENNESTRASVLAQRAIKENDTAITTSPKNVNFWKSRVKILYAFSAFDPGLYKLSLETLKKAQELSPNDPKIFYNIAVIAGKQGDSVTAIDALKKAIEMKPNYRDAYYALSIFYTESKQSEQARAVIRQYLQKIDPNDREMKELVQ